MKGVSVEQLARLSDPFSVDAVKWRVGAMNRDKTAGIAVPYIDACDVQERLDEICGKGNWSCKHDETCNGIICTISICIDGEWISKTDGAGHPEMTGDNKSANEFKGGLSDAEKRAARQWGIGRYLRRIKGPWVDLDNKRIKPNQEWKLRQALEGTSKSGNAAREAPHTEPQPDKPTHGKTVQAAVASMGFQNTDVTDALQEELGAKQFVDLSPQQQEMFAADIQKRADIYKELKSAVGGPEGTMAFLVECAQAAHEGKPLRADAAQWRAWADTRA